MNRRALLLLFVLVLGLGALPPVRQYTEASSPPAVDASTIGPVVMFSTRDCPYCRNAAAYFERHGIQYAEYDIEASQAHAASFNALGGTGVPLIVVGDRRMQGFTPRAFNRLLSAGS